MSQKCRWANPSLIKRPHTFTADWRRNSKRVPLSRLDVRMMNDDHRRLHFVPRHIVHMCLPCFKWHCHPQPLQSTTWPKDHGAIDKILWSEHYRKLHLQFAWGLNNWGIVIINLLIISLGKHIYVSSTETFSAFMPPFSHFANVTKHW